VDNADSENVIAFHRQWKDAANCEPELLTGDGQIHQTLIEEAPENSSKQGKKKRKQREEVERLIQSQSTLALSTVNADGMPHATPLFYLAGTALELYWFSSDSSQHSLNLMPGRSVGLAIYVSTAHWQEICGVQMRGTVEQITDRKIRRDVTRRYCERFHLGRVLRLALARSSLYVLWPGWIRYIDNSKHFGHKFEFTLPGDL
jgi:uncharacterized protein YhbP (UPF0306 family)